MRTVVLDLNVFEEDVKPQELLNEYRRLLEKDMVSIREKGLELSNCPGCQSSDCQEAFARFGMSYQCCNSCQSLYVSPRPSEEVLDDFYRNSTSANFWRQKLLPATVEARVSKLIRPRAQWLLDVMDEYCPEPRSAIAVGYHNDLLIEQLGQQQETSLFEIVVTNAVADIEFVGKDLSGVKLKPLPIAELGQLPRSDLFLAFDILDRCVDPDLLFAQAAKVLEKGGLLLATTVLGSGFDIQVLWDRADGVYPPERLNLLSVEGLTELYQRHGFEALESRDRIESRCATT